MAAALTRVSETGIADRWDRKYPCGPLTRSSGARKPRYAGTPIPGTPIPGTSVRRYAGDKKARMSERRQWSLRPVRRGPNAYEMITDSLMALVGWPKKLGTIIDDQSFT